ncbi:MAG: hypothetical protein A3I05_00675 [Deltaproteobacteria bacterium RIFCSPLOWO2_02_FULL_44_10]|nr:MAG: hypothetical protein A3I05_00675 [Deltaproteobacteria bacterium RIFCSPLOWO2_02_FULL_44_10]
MKKEKFYAYTVDVAAGITDSWVDCEKVVSGVPNAKFKGFNTREEAERWLEAGADYKIKHIAGEKGVYFDAGTGSGRGVEISVTDEKGNNLLDKVLSSGHINKRGKHWIFDNTTNNYGELLACKYALEIANQSGVKKIFGDSKLILDYWSKGFIKRDGNEPKTMELAFKVAKLREEFEKSGGKIEYISGGENPADLGFHKN